MMGGVASEATSTPGPAVVDTIAPPMDIPEAAYANTVRALDAFSATTAEYRALLETQRTMLDERNFSGVEVMVHRGDRLARDARAYGQQLNTVWNALVEQTYRGAMTDDLRTRIAAAEETSRAIAAAATELMMLCDEAQRAAAAELEQPSIDRLNARRRYNTGQYRAIVFDTVR